MLPLLRRRPHKRLSVLAIVAAIAITLTAACFAYAQTPNEGGVSFDGGGQEILQSIFVPYIANRPFSLTLAAEWSRPLNNGGSFTTVNSRPIKRDSEGRIYQERWLMTPKGSRISSQMAWIQIADPVAHTLLQCNARQKLCELLTLRDTTKLRFDPDQFKSGPLNNNKGQQQGTRTHEDLGAQMFAGLLVHEYKDTTTLNTGVLGNDMPMSTVRQYRFCPELGFNLTSVVDAPQIGRQSFTVTDITATEPDPSFFQTPVGYKVVDHRKGPPAE